MIHTKDCFPARASLLQTRAANNSRWRASPALGSSTPALDGRHSRNSASPQEELEVHGLVCISLLWIPWHTLEPDRVH